MGSALYPERCFHLINSSGSIFDDHISSRLSYFHPRNLVADRRAWSYCDGDGPDPVLVSQIDLTDYCLLLSNGKGSAWMIRRRITPLAQVQLLGVVVHSAMG